MISLKRSRGPALLTLAMIGLVLSPTTGEAQPVDPHAPVAVSHAEGPFSRERLALVPRLLVTPERTSVGPYLQAPVPPRDSLRNGAIIGAVIGAGVAGTFAAVWCHLYQEEGGASCIPDTLRFAAIGGAIGIGAGLAVDVGRSQNGGPTARLAITF